LRGGGTVLQIASTFVYKLAGTELICFLAWKEPEDRGDRAGSDTYFMPSWILPFTW
jgi:hypothetical protein